ncbi:MAG: ABC transporter permease [Candidatus Dormibacteraceae bacterium]
MIGDPLLPMTPAPGAAPLWRRVLATTEVQLRTTLGNFEQLLLQLAIPVLVLLLFSLAPILNLGPGPRVAFVAPGVLALAVLSAAFTGQAIATGFERRYGVLKLFGATPLGRGGLLLGKTLGVLATEALQIVVLVIVATLLGWRPGAGWAVAIPLLVLGTAAFSGLGLLLAGALRAEATLGAANLLYLLLLILGGVAFPVRLFPSWLADVASVLPITALTGGLRVAFSASGGVPWGDALILAIWTVLGLGAAALTFRWE